MLKNTKIQMMFVLVVGGLFGYAAASGWIPSFKTARAAAPPDSTAAVGADAEEGGGCCSEGLSPVSARVQYEGTEEAIAFELRVHSGAVVLIDGEETTATGTLRHFETP